jgi:hypothetical protein
MKKKGLNVKINFSNRWLYTFVVLGILIVIAVGVYALTPGVKPNPGHSLSEVGVPTGCTSGQVVSWNGTALVCTNLEVTKSTNAIYTTLNICGGNADSITTSPTCQTIKCGNCGSQDKYYLCTTPIGTPCSCVGFYGNSPITCNNTIKGYLVN